jgi:ubiquinone/menaquinone biosynthesis C-methylase UbiE
MPHPSVKEHYQDEAVARSYDREQFSGLVGRTFDALEKRAIRRLLRPLAAEIGGRPVLDLPGGTGRITELLRDQGFVVTGGDISEAMLEQARR